MGRRSRSNRIRQGSNAWGAFSPPEVQNLYLYAVVGSKGRGFLLEWGGQSGMSIAPGRTIEFSLYPGSEVWYTPEISLEYEAPPGWLFEEDLRWFEAACSIASP